MQPLKLFWARGTGGDEGLHNAGDWYSPLICEHLSGRRVVYAPPHRCELVAAGSLLKRLNRSHRLHRLGFKRELHIWGTGSLRPEDHLQGHHHVHAVRGKLTLDRISTPHGSVPLGDPGLLADRLIGTPATKRHEIGLVPHVVDRGEPEVQRFIERHPHAVVIDLTQPVRTVLETLVACERVLSSSLHGLVFADAFGIPNAWVTISGRLHGGRHKFDDYYSAFGLPMEPIRLSQVDAGAAFPAYARPGIEPIKSALAASFPCF